MKVKSYNDFLLESILYTSHEFIGVLKDMDDEIADLLLSLVNTDIKTNFNILNITDKNDKISFIPDNQTKTKLKSGMSIGDLFKLTNNSTSIGRICKSMLSDNKIIVKDKDIEIFVNKFKAAYDRDTKDESIKLVKGEDIRFWYLDENYCESTIQSGRGTLGKSCMRYNETQHFLDIYVENPDVCSLLILLNDDNKLVSRALVWKTNLGMYLDRIYWTNGSDEVLMLDWFRNKFKGEKNYNYGSNTKLEIQLDESNSYEYFPYMDSFIYYYQKTQTLYNYIPKEVNKKHLYELQDTDGGYERQDLIYCEFEGSSYPEDDVIFSRTHDSYISKDNAIWSKYLNSYIHRGYSVYSNVLSDYLYRDDADAVYSKSDNSKFDWYPRTGESHYVTSYHMDNLSHNYYIDELLILYNGRYYLKDNCLFVYNLSDNKDKEKYREIYHNNKYMCTKNDENLFGFKLSDRDIIIYSKRTYYNIYENTIFDDFITMIKSLDLPESVINLKIQEIENANRVLLTSNDLYKYLNYFHSQFGTEDKLMEWYKKLITDTNFNRSFSYAMAYSSMSHLFQDIKIAGKYTDAFKNILKKYVKDYPIDIYGCSYYSSNININEVKSQIKEDILSLSLPKSEYFNYDIDQTINEFIRICFNLINNILYTLNQNNEIKEYRFLTYYFRYNNKFKQ